jgi:hypothetical protein
MLNISYHGLLTIANDAKTSAELSRGTAFPKHLPHYCNSLGPYTSKLFFLNGIGNRDLRPLGLDMVSLSRDIAEQTLDEMKIYPHYVASGDEIVLFIDNIGFSSENFLYSNRADKSDLLKKAEKQVATGKSFATTNDYFQTTERIIDQHSEIINTTLRIVELDKEVNTEYETTLKNLESTLTKALTPRYRDYYSPKIAHCFRDNAFQGNCEIQESELSLC